VVKSLTLPLVALVLAFAIGGLPELGTGSVSRDSCVRVYTTTPPSVPAPYTEVCPA
jgi:hypothetical protein